MTLPRRAAIVHLGRPQAKGEARRVASWRAMLESIGVTVEEIPVAREVRHSLRPGLLADVARSRAVPERLAWSPAVTRAQVEAARPELVVAVTARAYDPSFGTGRWRTVVDLVDRLDRSYAQRAQLDSRPLRRSAWSLLSRAHRRWLTRVPIDRSDLILAGWAEAKDLGARWVPNPVVRTTHRPTGPPDHDALFVGTLRYPPNTAALRKLAGMWPAVLRQRPRTTLLVAGADPTSEVIEMCGHFGWELTADFGSFEETAGRAIVAVAPLEHSAGFQNKVLDIAALGIPQVVTRAALAGFAPGFPVRPVADDSSFVAELLSVLDDTEPARARAMAEAPAVRKDYGLKRWSEIVRDLIAPPPDNGLLPEPAANT